MPLNTLGPPNSKGGEVKSPHPIAILTVIMNEYDPDREPSIERVQKVLAGNQEIRCTGLSIDFNTDGFGVLNLRIPLHYVNIIVQDKENS